MNFWGTGIFLLSLSLVAGVIEEAEQLFYHGDFSGCEKLLEKGILLRSCANYRGLTEGDCRIAVRTHGENEQLIAALREVIGHA